jgi:hypothetical protein
MLPPEVRIIHRGSTCFILGICCSTPRKLELPGLAIADIVYSWSVLCHTGKLREAGRTVKVKGGEANVEYLFARA